MNITSQVSLRNIQTTERYDKYIMYIGANLKSTFCIISIRRIVIVTQILRSYNFQNEFLIIIGSGYQNCTVYRDRLFHLHENT